MASFTKEVNLRLAKLPLLFNGPLANRRLTPLVKEVTVVQHVRSVPQKLCQKHNPNYMTDAALTARLK